LFRPPQVTRAAGRRWIVRRPPPWSGNSPWARWVPGAF